MKGIEISEKFFYEYGEKMLKEQFGDILDKIAVGCVGAGSENFGFDDEISRDHDFEPSFYIFLPDESTVSRREEFLLERAYYKLPREYMGLKRSIVNPVGGARCGVIRTADFYLKKVGKADGNLSIYDWLTLPSYSLAEATNGNLFFDNLGEFTKIRNRLLDMPEDIRKKRIAGNLLLMAQSGTYNYERCLSHNETGGAQLSVIEFVKSTMQVIFLLNCRYMPFYKWSFKALKDLDILGNTAADLEWLISIDNSAENQNKKIQIIENLSNLIIKELKNQELTKAVCIDLEKHAYSVNDLILNEEIRNLNIFAAV